jgi:two-component system chemotaxis response regulator CheB
MTLQREKRPIRVLVIDDSAFMRKAISMMLQSDPDISVVGTARDGEEGIEKLKAERPDVVTLDIEMPRMAGMATLEWIMKEQPLPVLMVSSSTREGAEVTLKALELGAVDFVAKTLGGGMEVMKIEGELVRKVKAIARRRGGRPMSSGLPPQVPKTVPKLHRDAEVVAVGSSTGGPQALQVICSNLPHDFPCGVVLIQHMPAAFTGPLAARLNGLSKLDVSEAVQNDLVEPGRVLLAPGGFHMTLRRDGHRVLVGLSEEPREFLHRPSVDVTFVSAAEVYRSRSVGVVLTGMGSDGLNGIRAIKAAGGKAIAQDEESSVVYGMPRAVVEAGLADLVLPLPAIPEAIVHSV